MWCLSRNQESTVIGLSGEFFDYILAPGDMHRKLRQ